MGTVERPDAGSEVESCEEEEIVGGDELLNCWPSAMRGGALAAALQSRIQAEAIAVLPPTVRRRVRALKTLQKEVAEHEAKFYMEVHKLECKYSQLYEPLFDKRAEIVNGKYEPTDAECVNAWHDETAEEELADAVKGATITELPDGQEPPQKETMDPNVKGIPDFWYTIFKNVNMLSEMMQEHDTPIIKSLLDIKVQMHEEPMGFTLEFHFAPNEYFTNKVLTKEYSMKCKPDDDSPLEFEGPEIYACKGCEINWNKGKNVTVKTIKKKQKHKSRGSVRTVTKSVQADSFFNFFAPPVVPENSDGCVADVQDDDAQALLTTDFEIGHYIRERVVTRSVLLYTGEGLDDDDDYDDEEEEEECSTEESEDEQQPANKKRTPKKPPSSQPGPPKPAECKQQ